MKRIVGLLALIFSFCLVLPALADAADPPLPAGIIAVAPDKMSWKDAKAYCASKGGRLPLIGDSNSLREVPKGTSIDGVKASDAPWPSGLPGGNYWTGTENSFLPGYSWVVGDNIGNVLIGNAVQGSTKRVTCVP